MKKHLAAIVFAILSVFAACLASSCIGGEEASVNAPRGYNAAEYAKAAAFLAKTDENGVSNGSKLSPDFDPASPETWSRDIGGGELYGFVFEDRLLQKRLVRVVLDTPEGAPALVGDLDLSDCARLEYASASNNAFARVDLSGCKKLEELRIVSCGVSSLSVYGCGKLAAFEATGNRIEEFAFNRTPLMKFTHIYAMRDGTVGYIQRGGAAKLTAAPNEGHAFSGWYTAKAELISREAELDVSPDMPLIVSAKFRAPGPDAPEIGVSNDRDSGKPSVKWEKVPGAAYYSVARSENKYSDFVTLGISQGTSYIDRTAEPGASYYYHVTAVSPIGRSEPSFPRERTCDLARPEVKLKHVADSGLNKLVWDAQPAAVGYEVCRSDAKNGNYTLIATVTETSFVDTDPAPGRTYWYKLRALCGVPAANSAYTRPHSLTCDLPRPAGEAVRNDDFSVTLTWSRIDAAVGYEVFRSYEEDGEYLSVAVTEETSFTDDLADSSAPADPSAIAVYYKVAALASDPMANSAKSKPIIAEPIDLPATDDD